MSPRWIRRAVLVLCGAGIAGMIVSSIAERTGAAITFGLITAVAVVCLLLVTAVAGPSAFAGPLPPDEAAAEDVERRIDAIVAAGADDAEVRSLVRAVLRMERARTPVHDR